MEVLALGLSKEYLDYDFFFFLEGRWEEPACITKPEVKSMPEKASQYPFTLKIGMHKMIQLISLHSHT